VHTGCSAVPVVTMTKTAALHGLVSVALWTAWVPVLSSSIGNSVRDKGGGRLDFLHPFSFKIEVEASVFCELVGLVKMLLNSVNCCEK
jgi:hypothetical protein